MKGILMLYHLIAEELLGLITIKIYTGASCSSFLPLLDFYKTASKVSIQKLKSEGNIRVNDPEFTLCIHFLTFYASNQSPSILTRLSYTTCQLFESSTNSLLGEKCPQ
jgi:hypothetical protein